MFCERSQITLDGEIGVDQVTKLHDLVIGEVTNLAIGLDAQLGQELIRG
jgi:hypothetical protein